MDLLDQGLFNPFPSPGISARAQSTPLSWHVAAPPVAIGAKGTPQRTSPPVPPSPIPADPTTHKVRDLVICW